jgi:hypothetical protein
MTLNVISNVPDKKVIDPKPASRQGELDTPPMKKFARGRSVVFFPTQNCPLSIEMTYVKCTIFVIALFATSNMIDKKKGYCPYLSYH